MASSTVSGPFTSTNGFVGAITGTVGATTPATGAFTTVTASSTVSATGNLSTSAYIQGSVGNALTAVGTNRANSLALTKGINNITSAASGTGVTLPNAATVGIGGSVIVFNGGANLIQVYGFDTGSGDTIDGTAAATGVALTNAKRCVYICVAANTWISAQLGVVSA